MDKDLINLAFDRYEKMKLLDKLGNMALSRVSGEHDRDLELKKLDILTKKRMLGLPISSQDYEDAVNEDIPFYAKLAPGLSRRAFQQIPEPFSLAPHYKVAHSIADMLPSNVNTLTKAGSKYGSGIERILRAAAAL